VSERLHRVLSAAIACVLLVVAIMVLRRELAAVTWQALRADLLRTPRRQLLLALGCTVGSYGALAGYDLLAFRYIRKTLPVPRIALTAVLSYAVSNNVGFAMVSGASVRYRFYTRWGVTAKELSHVVIAYSVTFWLGLFALGGASLRSTPLAGLYGIPGGESAPLLGWLLMALPLAYILATIVRRAPLRIGRWRLPLPSPAIALGQFAISAADWALAGAALYVLLPPGTLSFTLFLGPFFTAVLLGMISHVPGGVGVFEGLLVLMLRPYISTTDLLPRLVVYRAVYFMLPLALALAVLVTDELRQRRARVRAADAARRSRAAAMTRPVPR